MVQVPLQPLQRPIQAPEAGDRSSTRLVDDETPADPIEEPLAERLLELAEHLGRRRLGQPDRPGGRAERAVPVDRQQQRHLAHAEAIDQHRGAW